MLKIQNKQKLDTSGAIYSKKPNWFVQCHLVVSILIRRSVGYYFAETAREATLYDIIIRLNKAFDKVCRKRRGRVVESV